MGAEGKPPSAGASADLVKFRRTLPAGSVNFGLAHKFIEIAHESRWFFGDLGEGRGLAASGERSLDDISGEKAEPMLAARSVPTYDQVFASRRGIPRNPAAILALLLLLGMMALVGVTVKAAPAGAATAPTGQGFPVSMGDLSFILKQITIAERHAATQTASDQCGTLVGPGKYQIPDRLTSYGLRTVDGSCNNLFPGREKFAASDQPFPRITGSTVTDNSKHFERTADAFSSQCAVTNGCKRRTATLSGAEPRPAGFPPTPGTPTPPTATSYTSKSGDVYDSRPRTISNLIVDQTSTNPAAIAAAQFPVRTQGNPGLLPCTTDPASDGTGGVPAGCVPSGKTLFIPNVTTDVGLSPPYNAMFTFFGQFFDHGVDQTVKSGGTVFVPLKDDDPLIAGKDLIPGNADDPKPGDPNFVPV